MINDRDVNNNSTPTRPQKRSSAKECSYCHKKRSAKIYPVTNGDPNADSQVQYYVCQQCLDTNCVTLCQRCNKVTVADYLNPFPSVADCQQKGKLQWLCSICYQQFNKEFPIKCLCGEQSFPCAASITDDSEKLNKRIYLCDTCRGYTPDKRCHVCNRVVTMKQIKEPIGFGNVSKYSNLATCGFCRAGAKICGCPGCLTPAADPGGKCFGGARMYLQYNGDYDYRCRFCFGQGPIIWSEAAKSLYAQVAYWFEESIICSNAYPKLKRPKFGELMYPYALRKKLKGREKLAGIEGYYDPEVRRIFIAVRRDRW